MRTILCTISISLFCTMLSAQNKVLKNSIDLQKNNSQSVVIRCGASIRNNEIPLFIIDGVPMLPKEKSLIGLDPNNIKSIEILKGETALTLYGSAGKNGVILISTKENEPIVISKKYAFKMYEIFEENWYTLQDVYNDIQSKVPSVSITSNTGGMNSVPNIRMRGDDNTIVIVDGIRYDASILNTLNPSDIESITVAPSVAASNYFRNN